MQRIGSVEISDRDYNYLVDGLAKLLPRYEVDRSSTRDINFIRQMMILQKKLERKRPNLNSNKK